MRIRISDLTGRGLHWSVAKVVTLAASGGDPRLVDLIDMEQVPEYSIDPGCAQPLFEANKISILWRPELGKWWACCDGQDPADEEVMGSFGPTQLIAGLRCLVQARLADEEGFVLL